MVLQELRDIGLSDAEAKVYVCLLENGPLRVSEISKKTGIYRPYVYDNLYKLIDKGLCSNINVEGKKQFKAASPETLKEYVSEKLRSIDQVVPELEKQMYKSREETSVWVFKGKNAVRKVLTDILVRLKENPKTEHLAMGIDEMEFLRSEPTFARWFIKQVEKYGIKARLLTFESARMFPGGKTTTYRLIPDEYFSPAQVCIDGDIVSILLLTSSPKYAIKIKSQKLADSYKKQFELMWKLGKHKK